MVRKMARVSKKTIDQGREFFEAIKMLEQERGIPADYLLEKVCAAIVTSVRKEYGGEDVVFVDCNTEENLLRVFINMSILLGYDNVTNIIRHLPKEEEKVIRLFEAFKDDPVEKLATEHVQYGQSKDMSHDCALLLRK